MTPAEHVRPDPEAGVDAGELAALRAEVASLRERAEDLERFADLAAHDLRGPLTAVSGYAQLLRRHYGQVLDDRGRDMLARLLEDATRLSGLLEALRSFASGAGRDLPEKPVDLVGVVADAVASVSDELVLADGRVEIGELPPVRGDAGQLAVLVTNLLSNAVKFRAPKRGLSVCVDAERVGADVVLRVADNGRGVPAEDRRRVLELYSRGRDVADVPGSGLGLATCARIAERHRGQVTLAVGPGGIGTTVTVRLPSGDGAGGR